MNQPAYRPPPRRRRQGTAFVTTAAVAVIVAVGITVTLIELASSGTVKNHLGTPTFIVGRTRDFAPSIAAQGPLLIPDPLGHDRNIYLQHLGPDPALGWVTILAAAPNEPARCVLAWQQSADDFRDPCSAATYPADGDGLVRYPTTVLPSGRVEIDLRTTLPADTTITTGTAPPPKP